MRAEGTLRERLCNKGQFVDVALYALLRSEFVPAQTAQKAPAAPLPVR